MFDENCSINIIKGGIVINSATGEVIRAKMPISPTGREEDGENSLKRDLTYSNKVTRKNYIALFDNIKKEVILLDKRKARLSKMRKRVFAWSNTMKPFLDNLGFQYEMKMIGLTYRPGKEWEPGHIREYIQKLKRKVGFKNIIGMARVAELQKRGAVHYHIIIVVRKGVKIPFPDKSGMWKYGSSSITSAKSPFYLVSYTKKEYQKEGEFPSGIRLYEVWINPDYVPYINRWFFRLSVLPEWLKNKILSNSEKLGLRWQKIKGGWLYDGELHKSPFVFLKAFYY